MFLHILHLTTHHKLPKCIGALHCSPDPFHSIRLFEVFGESDKISDAKALTPTKVGD